MPSLAGGSYATGTVSLAVNGTSLVGVSTQWSDIVLEGDWFYAAGAFGYVESVTDDTHIVLNEPWTGGALTAAPYRIYKTSWQRSDSSIALKQVLKLLAKFGDVGTFYFVKGAVPDPAIGDDGDFGLKVNEGAWNLWIKEDGIWVDQGAPVGISWKSNWTSSYTYHVNDLVTRLGQVYVSLTVNTNQPPEANPDDWDLLIQGGTRYEILLDASDRPDNGDNFRELLFSTSVAFPANMSESQAWCRVAPTADAIFLLKKNGTTVGSFKFLAGQNYATFTTAGFTCLVRDILEIVSPNPRDATLADLATNLVGYKI